jgi:transcriptional regulator with XRE-family HTH domain
MRELRAKRGLRQEEVSNYLHITRTSYSMYETGKRQMNYETLCMLADFYDVSTDYLLGRQDALPSFLSEEERTLISQYRALGEYARDAVKNALAFEHRRADDNAGRR